MSWAAGTQCVAKGDHKKPKPGELLYRKGDILTIVDTTTVPSLTVMFYRCCRALEDFYLEETETDKANVTLF